MISDSTYSDFIKNGLKAYIYHLNLGKKSGDYKIADDLLGVITGFQKKYGSNVMLSENKVNAEILYNKYDIF